MKRAAAVVVCSFALMMALAGCASQVETDLSVASQAEDTAGAANLQVAGTAASGYMAENGSYDGFNAAAASALEPAFKWVDGGAAASGVVSIRGASGDSVVLVTKSASGAPVCLAFAGGAQTSGTVDAQTAADCT